MNGAVQGLVGMFLLLGLAGTVQTSRNPARATARLGLAAGVLLLIGLGVFIARGDIFRASGLDDSADSACGYERVC